MCASWAAYKGAPGVYFAGSTPPTVSGTDSAATAPAVAAELLDPFCVSDFRGVDVAFAVYQPQPRYYARLNRYLVFIESGEILEYHPDVGVLVSSGPIKNTSPKNLPLIAAAWVL